ncbi:MAG: hypothetical protein ACOCUH_04070 [Bacteriovoracia bacterium]
MGKPGQMSRFELNKNVRTVLQRNHVDLTQLQFSCAGSKLNMYGTLLKDGGSEFSAQAVEAMMKEMQAIPGLRDIATELSNWNLNGGSIEKRGENAEKDKKNNNSTPKK